jgi:hypothetical protein
MSALLRVVGLSAALVCGLSVHSIALQVPDPFLGTWKVNVAKSSYVPGPAPRSTTAKYEAVEGGYRQTADGTDANGQPTHVVTMLILDGRDHPIQGNPNADAVAFTRRDARAIDSIWKKGGQVVFTAKNVVSTDGKVRTITQKGKDAQGRAINTVIVHEKQ